MPAPITKSQVSTAAQELASMRRSLASWLKFRLLNDKVLAGTAKIRTPLPFAQRVIAQSRDLAIEQDLATKLHVLLTEVMPKARLPNPDLRVNPSAAVELANIALVGSSPTTSEPVAVGGFGSVTASHPWLWPVLIVGGLLLAITTAIKTAADVAKDAEEKACIRAGACTDFGFFLKAGGIAALVYVAWNQLGVGDIVKGLIKKGRA